MRKFILLSSVALLSACANTWDASGVPGVYEGQSIDGVLQTLKRNHWQNSYLYPVGKEAMTMTAFGKPTQQYLRIFGRDCVYARFIFIDGKGLQALEATPCDVDLKAMQARIKKLAAQRK